MINPGALPANANGGVMSYPDIVPGKSAPAPTPAPASAPAPVTVEVAPAPSSFNWVHLLMLAAAAYGVYWAYEHGYITRLVEKFKGKSE